MIAEIALVALATVVPGGSNTNEPSTRVRVQSADFALKADKIFIGPHEVIENGMLVVEEGKIRAVGADIDIASTIPVFEHEGWLSAGLVASHSQSGGRSEVTDGTRAALPAAKLVHAFNPDHSDFEKARRSGITTMLLAPDGSDVIAGVTAVVKTGGGQVLSDSAHLGISMQTRALHYDRAPTSWGGLVEFLQAEFDAGLGNVGEAQAGRLPVLIEAWERHEVSRALAFATKNKLSGAIRGATRAGEQSDAMSASGMAAIVGPFRPGSDLRALKSVVLLEKAGVPLAFGVDAPGNSPDSMRLSSALCLREGLSRVAAWSAMTSTAADLLGVEKRVGRLERGRDADFVLWSGDPLELSSRVLSVWIDGAQVHGGQQ